MRVLRDRKLFASAWGGVGDYMAPRRRRPLFSYRPKSALAWVRWALDFKGRAKVRDYLDECERRVLAAFPQAERERMSLELTCFGRTEIRVQSPQHPGRP